MTYEEAIEYVAQQVASDRAAACVPWDGYPDIGDSDWETIEARVYEIATQRRPQSDRYNEAYVLLAGYAEAK